MSTEVSKALTFLKWYKKPSTFFKDIFKQDPYPYQAKVLESLKDRPRRLMLLAAGGTGKTKLLGAIALYYAVVLSKFDQSPYSIIIISGSRDQARNLYEYVRIAFKDNPILSEEVEGEPLMSITRLKNRSVIKAVPNSLKAIQGEHHDVVIIDEAALAGNFIIRDSFRIVAQSNKDVIILSGTPMNVQGGELFVEMWEDEERYPEWRRFHWSAKDCPSISIEKYLEAQKDLTEDMFYIFWEGKPYPRTGTLIQFDKLKKAVKGTKLSKVDPSQGSVIAGIDWGWCLDANTELLTKNRSWIKIKDIKENEEVLVYDPIHLETYYLPIKNIRIRDYYGYMVHTKHRNLEMSIRPNHPIPLLDRHHKHLHLHKAGDFVTHHYVIRKAIFNGEKIKYYKIPGYKSKRKDLELHKDLLIPIIPFLKLLGWYLTEGYSFRKGVVIVQDPKVHEEYFKEITDIIKQCGLQYSIYKNKIIIYNMRLQKYFSKLGKSKQKYIPKDIKMLHGELLIHLVDTMLKGDGDQYYPRFNTYSKQLAEDFLEVAFKTGKYHGYIVDRKKKGYRVNLSTTDSINFKWSKDLVKTQIATFEVPTEMVVTRYNGKISIQHNRDPTAIVIVQYPKDPSGTINILYADAWSREQYEDIHDRIEELCKQYNVKTIYTDGSDVGENQRLASRGLNVVPITFNQNKVQMQTNLKLIFHQERIKVPEEFVDLVRQLKKYNWDTSKDEDYVDALMLALYHKEETDTEYYYKII